jgi:pullulanase/glycogen debranching enzyme
MRGSKMEIRDWMNQERENRTKRTATGRIFIIAFQKESITNLFITMMIEKLGNNHQLKTDERERRMCQGWLVSMKEH